MRAFSLLAFGGAGFVYTFVQGFAIGGGEALTLASALLYGAHIVGLGLWSSARSAIGGRNTS